MSQKNPNLGGSYIDLPNCIKNKEVIINPVNKNDSKWFQYAAILALYYEQIERYSERITKNKAFIDNVTGKE